MLDFDKKARTAWLQQQTWKLSEWYNWSLNTRWERQRDRDYRQSNMLPIVQVIIKIKLRMFGHVTRREEESMQRVVIKLRWREGARPKGRPILGWLDNIDSQLHGKNTRRSLWSYLECGEQASVLIYANKACTLHFYRYSYLIVSQEWCFQE